MGDQAEQQRADALRAGDLRILQMIATGAPLPEVLDVLVRVIEEQADGMLGSVLLVEDGVRVRHGAAPHLPPAYMKAIDGQEIGPAKGSCGTAAYRRQPVIVEDIATDPLWAEYREVALAFSLGASWSIPIMGADHAVLGTFALYYSKPRRPTPELLELTGHATHLAAIAIERHLREEALVASEARVRLIYDHVADVLFHLRVDPGGDYRFVSLNPAFYQSTGLKPEQVIGKRVQEVIPEPSLSMVLARYDEAIRTKQTVRWDETTVFPTGNRHGDVSVTPVFDAQGQARFLIGSVRDVTDRKRLEEEVRQLQKMEAIGRLSGGIAHDFNNILAVILMGGAMLLNDVTDDDMREQVQEIIKAGERGAGLTRQFLAFSRKQVLRPEILDLNDVVANVEKMLRRLIGEDIDFRTVLAQKLWRVEADPGQVEQVIMNLVVNARDAMPKGGKLTIETANMELDRDLDGGHVDNEPGSYVMLAVTDTGCGMNEETKQRIFEPFFTTKEAGKGTGLGLATVFGIVKQSGGDVRVYSEVGRGSTFKIYLRRTTAMPVPKVVRPARQSTGRHVLAHVLVVEDEPALRATFSRLLPQIKCSVTTAGNAEEALSAVEAQGIKPDLLITDIIMPGMSGRALAERLRQNQPDLKVLYISGYPDNAIIHHGILDPGTPFLQKPFTMSQLSAAIEEVLDTA